MLKTQQRFGSEKHVFTEEINIIALSSSDDKKMQSIDWTEKYAYGATKDLVSQIEEVRCNNIINNTKMINFDDVTKESFTKNII